MKEQPDFTSTNLESILAILDSKKIYPSLVFSTLSRSKISGPHLSDACYFSATIKDQPTGFLALYNIDNSNRQTCLAAHSESNQVEDHLRLIALGLDYVFEKLKLRKVSVELLGEFKNEIVTYRAVGFEIEGIKKRGFFNGTVSSDIYQLAIFKKTWLKLLKPSLLTRLEGISKKEKINIGDSYEDVFVVTKDKIDAFAEFTGDYNPIHMDSNAARKIGFSDRISHGFLTSSFISKVIGNHFPGAGTIYVSQYLQFKTPVLAGETLKVSVKALTKIENKLILETKIYNAIGKVVIEGEAEVLVT